MKQESISQRYISRTWPFKYSFMLATREFAVSSPQHPWIKHIVSRQYRNIVTFLVQALLFAFHDYEMIPTLMSVLAVVAATSFFLLYHCFSFPHHSGEPPLIRPKIPIVGHLIGLLRYGTGYYSRIACVSRIQIVPEEKANWSWFC